MTLYEQLGKCVPPWRSLDALNQTLPLPPQQEIDVCLMCEYCADACDRCDGKGNLIPPDSPGRGRPKKTIDTGKLRELLRLRLCNREMCAMLGVSEPTLIAAKKQIRQEENE